MEIRSNLTWETYAKELGLNIARKRVALGWSQERVATDAQLSRFTYWKLEHGESNPGTPANPSIKACSLWRRYLAQI